MLYKNEDNENKKKQKKNCIYIKPLTQSLS